MPEENNNQPFFIESIDTVSAYNRLPLDSPVTFGIKLGFSKEVPVEELDDIRDRLLGIRVSVFKHGDGRSEQKFQKKLRRRRTRSGFEEWQEDPDKIVICDFIRPISRVDDEFFFEFEVKGSDVGVQADRSKFILFEYILRSEDDGKEQEQQSKDKNPKDEKTSGAKKKPKRIEEVLKREIFYSGDQPPVQTLQTEQRNVLKSIKDIGESLADGQLDVNILSSTSPKSPVMVAFKDILDTTRRIGFDYYQQYIDELFCAGGKLDEGSLGNLSKIRSLPFNDTDSYRILKIATEAFLMANVGISDIGNKGSDKALEEHFIARNIHFSANDTNSFNALWRDYINPDAPVAGDPASLQSLPYLYIIRRKFKELGIKKNWVDQVVETKLYDAFGEDVDEVEQNCIGIIQQRLRRPLYLELIWNYWQEEGMLVQAMNAISQRFQNVRAPGKLDPLAEMELTHLLPLNNIMWGYIQDEQHRLTLQRRAYEYDHHYGFTLKGKAATKLRSVDSRSRFIEAFHGLLHLVSQYYKDVTNKLVNPDPYPILNALREVHFIISEGMHNQYGALPTTARIEMLMQQWILARPEFKQFLPGRAAVPYTEPWMDRIASMNKLKGWTNVSPMHFNYLATYGEQLILSIRFIDWSDEDRLPSEASLWANYWRLQIQGYIHSYKVTTGVDLGAITSIVKGNIDARPPSFHLAKRLQKQKNGILAKTKSRRFSSNGRKGSTIKKETF